MVVQVHDTLRLFKGHGHMAMLIGKGQRPVNVDCHCHMEAVIDAVIETRHQIRKAPPS